jgi:glucokinase
MSVLVLGIDIGGTNTRFGVVDREGCLHAKGSLRTGDHETLEGFVKAVADGCRSCLAQIGGGKATAVGIGAPNANYYRGTVEHAPNLQWKGVLPLAQLVSEDVGLPTWLTNDANAAALGEQLYGGGRGMKNLVVVTLGTGVGSGYIVAGNLLYGETGFAGELGHVIVEPGGRVCGCGRRGCLEKYASATGLVLTVREKLAAADARGASGADGSPTSLRDLPEATLDAIAIHRAALAGDPLALEAYRDTAEVLGLALANTVAITSPAAVFLSGGLARSGDLLLAPTRSAMERNLHPAFRGVELRISALLEKDGAVLGAAALAFSERHGDDA